MNWVRRHWQLYAFFFVFALTTSYVVSRLDLIATCMEVLLAVSGLLVWRKKRPQDFAIESNAQRVFICLIWAAIFLGSYLVLRKTQSANYGRESLVVLGIVSLLLAAYFGSIGKNRWIAE